MKIAIIADTHFGTRKNSSYFMEQQRKFYDDKFFPYLKEHNITTIIHLGDFFDNRKTVNFGTLRHAKECFINPIVDNKYDLHMLVGNHDSFFKSNGDLTSTKLLFDDIPNITVYDRAMASTTMFGDKTFFMCPWIFPIQKEEMTERLRTINYDVVCGHFEMMGVVFQGNTMSRKGIDTDVFSHIPHVFSGHFHKKSEYYVGSPYAMTWADYDDPKRIIIYDTDTDETEDIYLADDTYKKLIYPDDKDFANLGSVEGKILRIIVKSKDNPAEFDDWIGVLECHEPQEIDIKEEHLYLDVLSDDDLDDDTDTLGVLLSSIDDIAELKDSDKIVIKEIMKQLYDKAGEK